MLDLFVVVWHGFQCFILVASVVLSTMGFGSYDENEHENRERQLQIETSDETLGESHEGEVTLEGSDDTDALIERLQDFKE